LSTQNSQLHEKIKKAQETIDEQKGITEGKIGEKVSWMLKSNDD